MYRAGVSNRWVAREEDGGQKTYSSTMYHQVYVEWVAVQDHKVGYVHTVGGSQSGFTGYTWECHKVCHVHAPGGHKVGHVLDA